MSTISILLIGASGAFGQPLLQEFTRQKSSFKRIAILAANEEKAARFTNARKDGIDVVVGSSLNSTSYAGGRSLSLLEPAWFFNDGAIDLGRLYTCHIGWGMRS